MNLVFSLFSAVTLFIIMMSQLFYNILEQYMYYNIMFESQFIR